jgi:hypothetical protein
MQILAYFLIFRAFIELPTIVTILADRLWANYFINNNKI